MAEDDLEAMRRLLAETPPPAPDAGAKAAARLAALEAFDAARVGASETTVQRESEKTPDPAQGSADQDRRKGMTNRPVAGLFRRLAMTFDALSARSVALGGASIAVLTIAVLAARQADLSPGSLTGHSSTQSEIVLSEERSATRLTPGANGPTAGQGAARTDLDSVAGAPADPAPAPQPTTLSAEIGQVLADDEATEAPARRERQEAFRALSQAQQAQPAAPLAEAEADMATGALMAPAPAASAKRVAPAGQSLSFAPAPVAEPVPQPGYQEQGRDRFEEIDPNGVKLVGEEPVSTFSIDVDTASYAYLRRSLMQGVLPAKDAVRIEELINYFPYDYAVPETREVPFRADVEIMDTPWAEGTQLMRIGIRGYSLTEAERPRANIVMLVDTSGSMNAPDKLPLLRNAFRLMVGSLAPEDTVSIVAYAGSAGTVLEPTPVSESAKILNALDRLSAGGSTAGGEGIRLAYQMAGQSFVEGGVNRVMLATDGDFNVGITNPAQLQDFVERKRESGVYLSVLGFGRGNLNDALMQRLAQNGNGQAAYIDTLAEARKALVEEATSTLFPIAQDVKIQVEFNPAQVAEYRLIGYETRELRREDFDNDKVDAGEIGAGHRVTAIYEITPVDSTARRIEALRYQQAEAEQAGVDVSEELAFLKIRFKQPGEDESSLITRPVTPADVTDGPTVETRFAAAVAGFGELLRGGEYMGDFDYDDVAELARGARGEDPFGYRAEFLSLVGLAESAAALERQR